MGDCGICRYGYFWQQIAVEIIRAVEQDQAGRGGGMEGIVEFAGPCEGGIAFHFQNNTGDAPSCFLVFYICHSDMEKEKFVKLIGEDLHLLIPIKSGELP